MIAEIMFEEKAETHVKSNVISDGNRKAELHFSIHPHQRTEESFAAPDRLLLEKSFMEIIKNRISLPSLPLHPSFSTCLITFPPTSAHSSLIFPASRNGNSAISFCLWQPLSRCSFLALCCRTNSFLYFNLSLWICLPFLFPSHSWTLGLWFLWSSKGSILFHLSLS